MYFGMAVLFVALALSGCGASNVVIEGSFPTPNINKIPVAVAVYYDDALREFSYLEYSETGQEEFNIESGQSHIELFNAVLPAMFDRVIVVDNLEDARAEGVDAVFAPVIEEFQLALPAKTKLDVYEVWIKYNMRLLTAEGDYIADWILTSYGKTPTETFRSAADGINEAAVVALRDLASSFSLSFGQVPEVRDWLSSLQS
ncbi:uncharacterized protein METZ01_LOCUS18357 [marine metagenome]|uniref:ABC-type transport auxiliary lipoprotein component domain-containing protein n=1 Tax=marine metagenome TaxID=408172 RepID=A0A381PJ93_9ZZZZ